MEKVHFKNKAVDLPIDRIVKYSNKDYIPFGKDNLFPQQVAKVSREAPSHRAIINSKQLYVGGNYFESEDKKTIDFLEQIRFKKDVYNNLLLDYLMGGNAYLELIKDSKNNLLKFYHQDFTKVRIHKDGDKVVVHNDWQNFKKDESKVIGLYPSYTKGDDGFLHTIFHIKDYEPEFNFYGIPSWFAGLRAANIAKKTNEFNDERLDNKFSIDGMLVIPGVSSPEDAKKIEKKLEDYQGAEVAGKVFTHYLQPLGVGEQREKAEFIPFNQQVDGVFMDLHRQSDSDLIKIHSWYRSLSAFEENTGFDTQRILNDYKMALTSVILPLQDMFLSSFNQILQQFGYAEVSIYNENPVYVPNNVEYVWEIRKRLGLDYNESDPQQQQFYAQISKGGI